jgi:hypothetical protein
VILRALLSVAAVTATALVFLPNAYGIPITSITRLNNFRDTRGLNDVGVAQGDRIQFGADVVPKAGTTIAAVQGNVALGAFPCSGLAVSPNFCARTVAFNPALTGAWTLTFQNGTDTATAMTPPLGAAAATPVPFPTNVTISGNGFTPTLSWTIPSGYTPDAVRINIIDKSGPNLPNGAKDVVHSATLAGSATNFVVPTTLSSGQPLKEGNAYVLSILLITASGPIIGNSGIVKESQSFFDFTPLRGSTPPQVLLPTVGPAPNPALGLGPAYQFQVAGVKGGQTIFVDPFVAIGYKYAIGAGNPNFASVMLPAVGDNIFTLSYLLGGNPILQQIMANAQFFFPSGGVSAFDVTGIETSAMLDPNNVTAFITGLTFVADGEFTGTMTPLVTDVALGAVPEPATLILLGSTFAGAGLARWRQRK